MTYTRQEAFNRAYLGLRAQGFKQALKRGVAGACVLMDDEGRRCAIGHLLADVPTVNQGLTTESQALLTSDWPFYSRLRRAHDNGYCPARLKTSLHELAAEFDLEVPQ